MFNVAMKTAAIEISVTRGSKEDLLLKERLAFAVPLDDADLAQFGWKGSIKLFSRKSMPGEPVVYKCEGLLAHLEP